MSNQAKQLRSQLRQVVKEVLPEVLTNEFIKDLQAKSKSQLEFIQKLVEDTLERIDERQKNVQSMIMREFAKPVQPEAFNKQSTPDETI